jgi:hypothetical protein
MIKSLSLVCACIFLALFMASRPAVARDAQGDNAVRIVRSSTLESGELDQDSQQLIAQFTGYGEFYVRTAKVHTDDLELGEARVFFVFASRDALRGEGPFKRIFCSGKKPEALVATGGDEELVRHFLQSLPAKSMADETLREVLPEILSAAIYANRAELWHCAPDDERVKARGDNQKKQAELRALYLDPLVRHNPEGDFVWAGRFLLGDGGVEDVTITIALSRGRAVSVKRLEVKPRNYFRNRVSDFTESEAWVVSDQSTWRPSKRDAFNFTLATLGNAKAKYQLGLTLMDECDENAKAEGISWLRAAAADGYGDAVTRLALLEADPRVLRDRESVRKDSCCRLPPRP